MTLARGRIPGMSPTARSLLHLRRLGFLAAPVEVYLHQIRRRRDLFGIGDVLAVHPRDKLVLLVQCTSRAHVSDRLTRIRQRPELAELLTAGLAVGVWGWDLGGGKWDVHRVAVEADTLATVPLTPPRRRRAPRQGDLFEPADVTPRIG